MGEKKKVSFGAGILYCYDESVAVGDHVIDFKKVNMKMKQKHVLDLVTVQSLFEEKLPFHRQCIVKRSDDIIYLPTKGWDAFAYTSMYARNIKTGQIRELDTKKPTDLCDDYDTGSLSSSTYSDMPSLLSRSGTNDTTSIGTHTESSTSSAHPLFEGEWEFLCVSVEEDEMSQVSDTDEANVDLKEERRLLYKFSKPHGYSEQYLGGEHVHQLLWKTQGNDNDGSNAVTENNDEEGTDEMTEVEKRWIKKLGHHKLSLKKSLVNDLGVNNSKSGWAKRKRDELLLEDSDGVIGIDKKKMSNKRRCRFGLPTVVN